LKGRQSEESEKDLTEYGEQLLKGQWREREETVLPGEPFIYLFNVICECTVPVQMAVSLHVVAGN
jgi:hypothetical protein